MQTVLVAEGAGFIGSHLCEFLLKDDYKVICVDNFLTSNKDNLDNLLKNPRFTFLEYDVTRIINSLTVFMSRIIFEDLPVDDPKAR